MSTPTLSDPASTQGHTDATTSRYVYQPIGTNIRVLVVKPGLPGSPLAGSLHQVHCGYFPFAKYDALSYTWGCSDRDKVFYTPEGILPITTSLSNALSRVRFPTHDIVIWADGICINQDDPKEKEYQVKYMGEIYRWAETVLLYLGEAEDESDLAFELLHNFVLGYGAASEPSAGPSAEMQARAAVASLCSKDWEPVMALFRRPWFRRAWVVQEFLLAKNPVFICGDWMGHRPVDPNSARCQRVPKGRRTTTGPSHRALPKLETR